MVTTFKGLANKWVVLALLLASLGAVLAITLLPAGAQNGAIEYAEDRTDAVANFTAVDPEGQQVTWNALDGTDAADFNLKDGVLTFASQPDFEEPADSDEDNTYELTLMATDGTTPGTRTVTVEVTNVNEAATTGIQVSLVQPREGRHITVRYADSEGNPYVDDDGVANMAIVDPDGHAAATVPVEAAETTIPAADVSWQWSRSTNADTGFVDITEEENSSRDDASYLVVDADRNHYLRVTATYTDLHGKDKELMATSLRQAIRLRDDQVAPAFPEDFDLSTALLADSLAVTIPDGAPAGSIVGGPVIASREAGESEILTYSLVADTETPGQADHADLFAIDTITGQVRVAPGKTVSPASDENDNVDDPKGDTFTVLITANDGAADHMEDDPNNPGTDITVPHTDTVVMTITVTEADEDPVFTKGETSHEYAENKVDDRDPPQADLTVYTFAAYDPEDQDVAFTLSGADMGDFATLTAAANAADDTWDGTLTFASAPDYENPADADEDNIYEVTLTASSGAGADEKETAIDITVEVTNEDDDGTLSLSARQPRIGVPISAVSLSDLDGSVSNVSYQWSVDGAEDPATACADVATWADAGGDGTKTDTYTPELADDGKCIRARATYSDPQGSGNANAISSQPVQKARNLAPKFADEIGPRYVDENAAEDALVIANESGDGANDGVAENDRVIASDALDADDTDNNSISYALSGADAKYFDITSDDGSSSIGGQINISAAGAGKLDYEVRRSYTVTVTASDLEGLSSSTRVTINVDNVNEGPDIMRGNLAVSGPPLLPYDSMGTDDVATYTAEGVYGNDATWSLSGDDAGDFSISTTGVLSFVNPPNVNNPADANSDNVYMVTVVATSTGGEMAQKMVTVTVGAAMEAADPTSLSDFTSQQRFDLDGNGIVDDSELRQAITIWITDNPEN